MAKFDFTEIQNNEVKEKQYKNFIKESMVYLQQIKDVQDAYNDLVKDTCENLNNGLSKDNKMKTTTLSKIAKTLFNESLEEEREKLEELEDGLTLADKN